MTQNSEDNSTKHPYTDYENTSLWKVVDKSVSELEENQDIKLSTPREYVIGYICKQINECLENDRF
jgi:hypothetical protein